MTDVLKIPEGDSMIDLEELKRMHEFRDQAYMDGVAWRDAIAAAFPAIVAKLEAAQRLRDAAEPFCKIAEGTMGRIPTERLSCANYHELWKSVAAFDKEQQ